MDQPFTLSIIVGLDGAVMELNAVTSGHHLRVGESGSSVALIADNPSTWRMLANLAIAAAEEEERTLLAEAITHAPKVKPVVNQEDRLPEDARLSEHLAR
jgi:hypothetical protein